MLRCTVVSLLAVIKSRWSRVTPGVHVAYIVIDAVIDLAWTRKMMPHANDDYFLQPSAIVETTSQIAHQDRSAWTFNVEVRPFGEVW